MIYELGILHHGIPLISRQYYEEYKVDPLLRGGFLSALNSFAEEVFSDEIDSFNMKNFKIIVLSQPFANTSERIFSYCIGGRKISPKVAKRALIRILEEFNQKYSHLKTLACDLAIFEEFLPILDEILGDLARSTDERARSVFG
ncbi:MAG: hypothetical protein ACFFD2_25615 [Promethearchaeota archaeon]